MLHWHMKTSLSHLPDFKQEQILQVAEIISEVVRPEKIILFGSYARGTWVEDTYFEEGIRYEYRSDYDFLVVTQNRQEKDYLLSDKIVNRARRITSVVVNPIILELDYINEGLEIGQYFFTDIIKEGVLLYDSGRTAFAVPRVLTRLEQKEIAEGYFKQWFNQATEFLEGAIFHASRAQLNVGVFTLHQATENFYNTVLLVFTGYKPKTHSLEKLRQFAKPYSRELFNLFAVEANSTDAHLFDLLKRGYIDARYKHDYAITSQELCALLERIGKMQQLVASICHQQINHLV